MRTRTRLLTSGYTLIEVMMSVGVLSVGAVGLMAMQDASLSANGAARMMATATHIQRRWLERFRRNSKAWIASGNPPAATRTLSKASNIVIATSYVGAWITPDVVNPAANGGDSFIGPGALEHYAAGVNGLDIDPDTSPLLTPYYCTHARLAWVVPNHALRVDVRTYWRKMHNISGATTAQATELAKFFIDGSTLCAAGTPTTIAAITAELGTSPIVVVSGTGTKPVVKASRIRAVYGSTVVRWNTP